MYYIEHKNGGSFWTWGAWNKQPGSAFSSPYEAAAEMDRWGIRDDAKIIFRPA